jgi:hypothetical protein
MSERYLANENFPAEIVRALRAHGHDVLYAAEKLLAAIYEVILQTALEEDRSRFRRDGLPASGSFCSWHCAVPLE